MIEADDSAGNTAHLQPPSSMAPRLEKISKNVRKKNIRNYLQSLVIIEKRRQINCFQS